ncbi:RING finger and WD repeat domain-containing protein 3 [Dimargaris verticillata]|uniref:RING-type E3 ubiquitin transferase n=1 Tax=Dimargaris verticillata TaxID=2761393 RepID=A0A9W8BC12_9FUNG|nr:RING finger and WD repeat domain-containing protein 3 [Dimargaris verticillata]
MTLEAAADGLAPTTAAVSPHFRRATSASGIEPTFPAHPSRSPEVNHHAMVADTSHPPALLRASSESAGLRGAAHQAQSSSAARTVVQFQRSGPAPSTNEELVVTHVVQGTTPPNAPMSEPPPSPSPNDFQPVVKRPRLVTTAPVDLPLVASAPGPEPAVGNDGEKEGAATVCIICFEPMTSAGSHRMVSLRCGHLFGRRCIWQWLNGRNARQRTGQRNCPQCKEFASTKHVHPVYAKQLAVLDNTELESMREKYHEALTRCHRAETELSRAQLSRDLLKGEMTQMEMHMAELRRDNQVLEQMVQAMATYPPSSLEDAGTIRELSSPTLPHSFTRFHLRHAITVSRQAHACRVLAFNPQDDMLLVSTQREGLAITAQRSQDPVLWTQSGTLDAPYGLVKISAHDPRHSDYLGLHSRPIRDIAQCPHTPHQVLTTSLDKTVKLVSTLTNTVAQSYILEAPGWSCCWHPTEPTYFMVGLSNGSVLLFDTRVTTGPVAKLLGAPLNRTPVHSLLCAQFGPEASSPLVLVAGSSNAIYWSCQWPSPGAQGWQGYWDSLPSPTQLSCYCITAHAPASQLLASYRNPAQRRLVHQVHSFTLGPIPVSPALTSATTNMTAPWMRQCHIEYPSRQVTMARTCLASFDANPDPQKPYRCFVVAGDDTTAAINLWDTSASLEAPTYSLSAKRDHYLDLKVCRLKEGKHLLVGLSDTQVCVYERSS